MSHDNICTRIKELHEKAESIRAQMMKHAEHCELGVGCQRAHWAAKLMTRQALLSRVQNRLVKPTLFDRLQCSGRNVHEQKVR